MGMAKIYLGPAGVPISSKDRSSIGGIRRVAELKLSAFECEFVRGVKMSNELARECGEVAKELKIKMSVHAPYFVNLSSMEREKIVASKRRVLDSVERAHLMGADVVVFHPGYYGGLSEEEAYQMVRKSCEDMLDKMKSKGWRVALGLETTGKVSQFGTLEEIIKICKEVKGCVPVADFAHIHGRTGGSLKNQDDYGKIFDKLKALKLKHLHTHFSSIEYTEKGERRHLTIDKNQPPFKPLAEEILKRGLDITIISESPNLEIDALKMREAFQKLSYKF